MTPISSVLTRAATLFATLFVFAAIYGYRESFIQLLSPDMVSLITSTCASLDMALAAGQNVLFGSNGLHRQEAFFVYTAWLITTLAASDVVADFLKYHIGVAALQDRASAEYHSYATLKSSALWHTSEIERTEKIQTHKTRKYTKTCEQLGQLQRENEVSSTRLESIRNTHNDVSATIARLSPKNQAAEAACSTTASRLLELTASIDKLKEAAELQAAALRSMLARRTRAMQKRRNAVQDKRVVAAALKNDIAEARQTLETTLAALVAQRAALKTEQMRLSAVQRNAKASHEQELEDLAKHTSFATESFTTAETSITLTRNTRQVELAALGCRAAAAQQLQTRKAELANFNTERAELRDKISSLNAELVGSAAELAHVPEANVTGIAALTTRTVHAHADNIAQQMTLEERKATLIPAAAFSSRLVTDTQASLEFSATEHRLHMEHCAASRVRSTVLLAGAKSWLDCLRSAKVARTAEVAALRAARAPSDEQRADLAGLQLRLERASEGWADARAAQPKIEAELRAARRTLEDTRARNYASLRALRRHVRTDYTEGLTTTLAETKARAEALEAAAQAARGRGDATLADLDTRKVEEEAELALACEDKEEKEDHLRRLKEELAAIRGETVNFKDAREDGRLSFNKQLKKATERHQELHGQLAEADSTHSQELAGLEERVAALRKAAIERIEAGWVDEASHTTAPGFVWESSRDGTPAREEVGQDTSSYPVTPGLTRTSGTWSRTASLSPALPSPVLYECSALVARIVGDEAESEQRKGAEVKSAEGKMDRRFSGPQHCAFFS
ncbi:hypothetical protein PsYK624_099000 [Phanerochaete sordida]|uniref:Uncharacterized protein n=1 Tax=Phanerochaete sordida TaxID=48140 RepID=A0A9P3GHJ3_9APHY|nr:hypothetical protein PsYK624_099000 [Phanerochaete sordida]